MKIKTLFLITILSIIFIGLTNGEEVNLSNEISGKYGVFFCNNKENPTTELQITTMPGNENEICLYFVNESNYDIELEVGIVDGEEIEGGQTRTLGCNLLTQHSKIFDYTEQDRKNPIKIPANTRITKNVYITFPIGIEGEVPTCLVYGIVGDTKPAGDMFFFKFRNSSYLDFFVAGEFTGENKISIKKTDVYLDPSGAIMVDGIIKNDSALNNTINITGTISNIFGYHKEFILSGIKLKASGEYKFSNQDLNGNNYLPRYKGLFNIKLDISYQPYFEFDASNLNLDPDVLKEKQMTYSTSYFEMPRLIVGISVLVILLLILALRKPKTKVVYVNQNNPQQ